MDHPGSSSVGPASSPGSGAEDRPLHHPHGTGRWAVVALSALCSAASVSAAGCLCAFVYPILKELRAGTVRGQGGTEERILGFWSILVLSVLVGCISSTFSWTLTYLDSPPLRDATGHRVPMGYVVVILNGIMAMLTVIWILT